jgi:arylformamidase
MQLQRQEMARSPLALSASNEPWIDVSVPIRGGMVHWPGNPEVVVAQTQHLRRGDPATVSFVSLGVHTGTHVDAPVHFLLDGASVDSLPLDPLIGAARVLDMDEIGRIRPSDLEERDIRAGERILFKTRNSRFWKDKDFRPDYTCLTPEAARWLVQRGVRTVGIDYLSVAPMDEAPETHEPLLAAGICVIEGLDGAPARVVLRKSQLESAPQVEEERIS